MQIVLCNQGERDVAVVVLIIWSNFIEHALAEHVWTNEHTVDWMNVKVLTVTSNYNSRIIKEAFAMQTLLRVQ